MGSRAAEWCSSSMSLRTWAVIRKEKAKYALFPGLAGTSSSVAVRSVACCSSGWKLAGKRMYVIDTQPYCGSPCGDEGVQASGMSVRSSYNICFALLMMARLTVERSRVGRCLGSIRRRLKGGRLDQRLNAAWPNQALDRQVPRNSLAPINTLHHCYVMSGLARLMATPTLHSLNPRKHRELEQRRSNARLEASLSGSCEAS